MVSYFNRPPRPHSTDWGAQQFLRMLEREEQEAAELKRLKESGWQPPQQPIPPDSGDVVFGDGRDAIVDQVQAGIDHRNALLAEAQRRAALGGLLASSPTQAGSRQPYSERPELTLISDGPGSRPSGGIPPRTPVEMSPGIKMALGLGVGTGLAMSGEAAAIGVRRWLENRKRELIREYGSVPPYPGSPAYEDWQFPEDAAHSSSATSSRIVTESPADPQGGKSPGSAVADFEAHIRPAPSPSPEPIDQWSIEKLIPPEIAPQDLQPGGYADGSPIPKLEPLIREAWSPTGQELLDWLLSLNSKGSALTQRGVDQIAGWIIEGAKARGYTGEHEHGGTSRKEKYYAAQNGGRWGSGRTDGSVLIGRVGERSRRLDFNTAKFLQDRITPVAHERRALEKLRRLQSFANKTAYGMWAFPKEYGFTRQDWEDQVKGMIDDLLTDLLGPPK